MRNLLVLALIAPALLVACGQAEPPADVAEDTGRPPAEAVAETPPPAAPPEADEEATPTLVEESASEAVEADPEDVPLMLAQAEAEAPRDWKFREGTHFVRLVPTQPTVGGADKVEVAEIFWYGCGHCYNFEPYIKRWNENKPANARFVRIPAMWNPLVKLHAQLYYTEEVLAKNGQLADPEGFHEAVFREYHQRNNRLASEGAIQALFERFGVSEADFQKTWKSFEVAQKLRVADDLARRYGVSSVPSIVVNGKYRTGASETVGLNTLLDVINELVARESVR